MKMNPFILVGGPYDGYRDHFPSEADEVLTLISLPKPYVSATDEGIPGACVLIPRPRSSFRANNGDPEKNTFSYAHYYLEDPYPLSVNVVKTYRYKAQPELA